MGKPTKNKNFMKSKGGPERTSKAFDEDTAVFINMSQELKEEGNRLFQRRDHEGAMLKYEKALKLLPRNHIDVAYLRSNMAACYMQMGYGEYPRAIHECNLALEVAPKYSKALLKRARCYEAVNRLDLALRDVNNVLSMEPNNLTALEIADRVKKAIDDKGVEDKEIVLAPEVDEPQDASILSKPLKDKVKRKKSSKFEKQKVDDIQENRIAENKQLDDIQENRVVEEKEVDDDLQENVVVEKKKVDDLQENIVVEKKKVDDLQENRVVEKKKVDDLQENKVVEKKKVDDLQENRVEEPEDRKTEDKVVVEEKHSVKEEKVVTRPVKLILEEDIRYCQLPVNCTIRLVRDIVVDRFPNLQGVLIKYKDQEGDLVTITTTDELRLAEVLGDNQGVLRLYIAEVSPSKEPLYERMSNVNEASKVTAKHAVSAGNGNMQKGMDMANEQITIVDWIIQFARIFKNHVGFDCDSYLDLHEIGMKLYSEAMEDTVTSEDAQGLFDIAAGKFQELAALAMFNWGNVHMSRARKRVFFTEDGSRETMMAQIKSAYEWAQKEYTKAAMRYEEALKIKPDFYEGLLALGQQQFEQAKLSWYYLIGTQADLEIEASAEVLDLYNKAEDSMERGLQMWEEMEEQRLNGLSNIENDKAELQKFGLEGLLKPVSADEAIEQAANMTSQIYLLWGTLLYERSVVEFKLSLPTWEECLEVSIEKFELAGASPTDIAVMVKNHCSNETALEGFKVDEIVQAWNEMYDANRWQSGVSFFRLEPLFRRRSPKLHSMLEHI